MCCPCRKCSNTQMLSMTGELQLHLLTKGFMEDYTRWTCRDEEREVANDGLSHEAEVVELVEDGHVGVEEEAANLES